MSASVLYMLMSLDGYIVGPNDEPGNPGGDAFMRLHEWYGDFARAQPSACLEGNATTPLHLIGDRRWTCVWALTRLIAGQHVGVTVQAAP